MGYPGGRIRSITYMCMELVRAGKNGDPDVMITSLFDALLVQYEVIRYDTRASLLNPYL